MKRILLLGVAGVALMAAGAVNAADLPRKALPMVAPPPPVFSWTGCYVGAQAGGGWGRKRNEHTEGIVASGVASEIVPLTSNADLSGGAFGGQVGCDYQFTGGWVIGVRGNALAADIHGSGLQLDEPAEHADGIFAARTNFLASVTGRLGYSWNTVLAYVNGGAAWAHDKYDFSRAAELALVFQETFPTESRTGWTVGVGVEWAFAPNWSAFAEFAYYDFGDTSRSFTGCSPGLCETPRFSLKQQIETVMIGVNYRFNLARY